MRNKILLAETGGGGGDSWETMFDPRKACTYKRVTLVRNLVPSITNLCTLVSLLIIA